MTTDDDTMPAATDALLGYRWYTGPPLSPGALG